MSNLHMRVTNSATSGVKYRPSAVPMIHWPACRPPAGAAHSIPADRQAATAPSGPIIHGSGACTTTQTSAAASPIARPLAAGNHAAGCAVIGRGRCARTLRESASPPGFSIGGRGRSFLPASAQRPNQGDTRRKPSAQDADRRALVVKRRGLNDHDGQIVCRSRPILIQDDGKRFPRGFDGLVLNGGFLLENLERRQIVLDFLKSGENGLPVIGHVLVVGRNRLSGLRTAQSGVENDLRQCRTER